MENLLKQTDNKQQQIIQQKLIEDYVKEKLQQDQDQTDQHVDFFAFEIKIRESVQELISPLAYKLSELRADWQGSEKELNKLQQRFLDFEDQFISVNNNNPQTIQRRQALIDLVFRKISEAEEIRHIDQQNMLQKIQGLENKQNFLQEKQNIQETNFLTQSNIIDTAREELYENQRKIEDKKDDLVQEINSINDRLNKRLDEIGDQFREAQRELKAKADYITQIKQQNDQNYVNIEKNHMLITQLQEKFRILESKQPIEDQIRTAQEMNLRLKKLQTAMQDIHSKLVLTQQQQKCYATQNDFQETQKIVSKLQLDNELLMSKGGLNSNKLHPGGINLQKNSNNKLKGLISNKLMSSLSINPQLVQQQSTVSKMNKNLKAGVENNAGNVQNLYQNQHQSQRNSIVDNLLVSRKTSLQKTKSLKKTDRKQMDDMLSPQTQTVEEEMNSSLVLKIEDSIMIQDNSSSPGAKMSQKSKAGMKQMVLGFNSSPHKQISTNTLFMPLNLTDKLINEEVQEQKHEDEESMYSMKYKDFSKTTDYKINILSEDMQTVDNLLKTTDNNQNYFNYATTSNEIQNQNGSPLNKQHTNKSNRKDSSPLSRQTTKINNWQILAKQQTAKIGNQSPRTELNETQKLQPSQFSRQQSVPKQIRDQALELKNSKNDMEVFQILIQPTEERGSSNSYNSQMQNSKNNDEQNNQQFLDLIQDKSQKRSASQFSVSHSSFITSRNDTVSKHNMQILDQQATDSGLQLPFTNEQLLQYISDPHSKQGSSSYDDQNDEEDDVTYVTLDLAINLINSSIETAIVNVKSDFESKLSNLEDAINQKLTEKFVTDLDQVKNKIEQLEAISTELKIIYGKKKREKSNMQLDIQHAIMKSKSIEDQLLKMDSYFKTKITDVDETLTGQIEQIQRELNDLKYQIHENSPERQAELMREVSRNFASKVNYRHATAPNQDYLKNLLSKRINSGRKQDQPTQTLRQQTNYQTNIDTANSYSVTLPHKKNDNQKVETLESQSDDTAKDLQIQSTKAFETFQSLKMSAQNVNLLSTRSNYKDQRKQSRAINIQKKNQALEDTQVIVDLNHASTFHNYQNISKNYTSLQKK
eukprot:403352372